MAFKDWLKDSTYFQSAYNAGSQIGKALRFFNPYYTGQQIGSAIGQFNQAAVQSDRDYNSAEAEKQRQWETEMSNTAVQRQVADINAAGLNPWLAIQGGASGASTPAGASASSNSAFAQSYALTQTTGQVVNAITKLSSSAMSVISNLAKALA